MKNQITIIFIFLISISFAQSEIEIHLDYDPGVSYSGQTITHYSTEAYFQIPMKVINNSNNTIEIFFRRVILESDVNIFDQFCDQISCYSCGSDSVWSSPIPNSIISTDSSTMKPQGSFNNYGYANIRYFVINSSDESILDSVDLNLVYSSVTGSDYLKAIKINEYPNPANQFFNVDVQSANNLKLSLFSITGEKVYETQLYKGKNQLNLDNLSSGMYLYSIISGEENIKTKRLIIK